VNTISSARRPLFQRSESAFKRALLLLLVCAGLMIADQRSHALDGLRDHLATATRPLLWLVEQPSRLQRFTAFLTMRAEEFEAFEKLRQQQLQLMARVQRVAALEAENRRLRALLSSSEVLEARALVAEVMAASQDPYQQRLTLNRGSADGVYRGQAVIDAHGVLGQVVRVHRTTAIALLITDPDHGIPVEVNRTGLQTMAMGRGDGHSLSLPFLPGNADLRVGDLLVSSSLGGRFPAGYPVAEVREIRYTPGDPFMEAIAVPSARVNQSRQVLLLWDRQDRAAGEEAAGEDAAAEPAQGLSEDPAGPTGAAEGAEAGRRAAEDAPTAGAQP